MDLIQNFLGQIVIFLGRLVSSAADLSKNETSAQIFNVFKEATTESDLALILKKIGLIVTIIFGSGLLYLGFKFLAARRNKIKLIETLHPPKPALSSAMINRWGEIKRHIESSREAEWKFAVIEADKLADDSLKKAGFPGETMGDRMMAMNSGQLQTLQGLWDAHKVRNRVAHDINYFLRHAEARRAIELYEKSLQELGAIE